MSVLSCARYNCENIMCDRYSHTYGYICDECFEELVEGGEPLNIKTFMESKKKETINDIPNRREILEAIFSRDN